MVATFEGDGREPQAFCFPAGRPTDLHPRDVMTLERDGDVLLLTSTRLLDTVRVHCDGVPGDDAFCLEPGRTRRLPAVPADATVTALNLAAP